MSFVFLGCYAHLDPFSYEFTLKRVASASPPEILDLLKEIPSRNPRFKLMKFTESSINFRYDEGWDFAELYIHCYELEDKRSLIRTYIIRKSLGIVEREVLQLFWSFVESLAEERGIILSPRGITAPSSPPTPALLPNPSPPHSPPSTGG